jgi:4-hydroxythreonine-4-phosphate dehydrogenase
MSKPIALTCGDPNGVGIDLAFEAAHATQGTLPFFMIADHRHLGPRKGTNDFQVISTPCDISQVPAGVLPILDHSFTQMPTLNGMQPENAKCIIDVIKRAVSLVQDGHASALCTNPIHKRVLQVGAQFAHPGHTEFLAHLAGRDRSVMMLLCDELRVVPVTIHIALNDVAQNLTPQLLRDTVEITHRSLVQDFGIEQPRISIAGLNPHAGEQGSFGREEIDIMMPVINELRAQGMDISDPRSADTMFHAQARAQYDVAICMYHDQALIPIKTIDFYGGVNATLGLPFIRTSPDHGTAFDLAGTRKANPDSLIAALKTADKMAKAREQYGS